MHLSARAMLGALLAALIGFGACGPKPMGRVDEARIARADSEPQNWLTAGRDAGKTHFSSLSQINRRNVARLGFAWAFETRTNRVLEATPIVVDGGMFTSGPLGRVWALDARTGALLWRFTPQVDGQINRKTCCDQANRGVAVWKGAVYVAALDGMLYALDARSGAVLWRADTIVDKTRGYSVTGAPEIAGDLVLIGNAGGEFDVRGYVSAYDRKSGALRWRFFTIPDENDPASKTWSLQARRDLGGGGAPYDAIHYDPQTGLVFVGTGNAGPYPRKVRDPGQSGAGGGDNLYVASVLALEAKTGRLIWAHQQTPGDQWDFTATQPMILTDLTIKGARRKVLMQAPKNGFFYVYDRRTGEVLSAKKFARADWASHVDLKTGRPQENASADYSNGPRLIAPAAFGAHNWNPMAYSPRTGLVYIPAVDSAMILWAPPQDPKHRPGLFAPRAIPFFLEQIQNAPDSLPPPVRAFVKAAKFPPSTFEQGAYLRAWDPVAGKVVWQSSKRGWWDHAGVLATGGGLVFQGSSDGVLRAYDDRTGALLQEIDTGSSILAAPMTYAIAGVQYVSVMAAWGGGGWNMPHEGDAHLKHGNMGRILTFRLDGGATPKPPLKPALGPAPASPPLRASAGAVARGQMLFQTHCIICHANIPDAYPPDLRRMDKDTHAAFDDIVLGGALKENGMPAWDDVLSAQDARALHAYLIADAHKARAARAPAR